MHYTTCCVPLLTVTYNGIVYLWKMVWHGSGTAFVPNSVTTILWAALLRLYVCVWRKRDWYVTWPASIANLKAQEWEDVPQWSTRSKTEKSGRRYSAYMITITKIKRKHKSSHRRRQNKLHYNLVELPEMNSSVDMNRTRMLCKLYIRTSTKGFIQFAWFLTEKNIFHFEC
jgi:hypothetical protein